MSVIQRIGAIINDSIASLFSTWSSTKIASEIAAAGGGCIIVADQAAANALTGLSAGACILVEGPFNADRYYINVISTPDGTITNVASVTDTLGWFAGGSISDNPGGGDAVTSIPLNSTIYNLVSNGSFIHLKNMTGSTVSGSQRLRLGILPAQDDSNWRIDPEFKLSFTAPNNNQYQFYIRTSDGGIVSTLATGQQATALGANSPVHVTINLSRGALNNRDYYLAVERVSGGGVGDLTLKTYTLRCEISRWKTNK